MKAEHRKELQTNELADWLGRHWQSLRSGERNTALVVGLFALLALGVAWAWYHFAGRSSAARSDLWVRLDAAGDLKSLEEFASGANSTTLPGRVARFQLARAQYQQGLKDLYSDSEKERTDAIGNVEKARAAYQQLAEEVGSLPLLHQQALMGAAKAEEALVGVPAADSAGQDRGSLDRALALYQQLAGAHPDGFLGKAAAARAKEIQERRAAIEKFYADLNQRSAGPTAKN